MLASTRACVACVTAFAITSSSIARADTPPPPVPTATDAPLTGASQGQTAARAGLAILARPGAESAAWALAKGAYARDALRPAGLDEARARVLAGDAVPANAPQALKDLADERAAIRGDDGASRALLLMIASQLGVRGIVVVEASAAEGPSARVFFVDSQTFDAARYTPDAVPSTPAAAPGAPGLADAGAPAIGAGASDGGMHASSDAGAAPLAAAPPSTTLLWSGAIASLERTFTAPVVVSAPALATSPLPAEKPKQSEGHPFYTSPWFWGAVGAAVFGGTAVYFATRDNSTSTIHLELQVPK